MAAHPKHLANGLHLYVLCYVVVTDDRMGESSRTMQLTPEQIETLRKLEDHEYKEPIRYAVLPSGETFITDADGKKIGIMPRYFDPIVTAPVEE
jgi:hypothetical protein